MTMNASSDMGKSKTTRTDYVISKSGLGFVLHRSERCYDDVLVVTEKCSGAGIWISSFG